VAIDDARPSDLGDSLAPLHALDARNPADLGEKLFQLLTALEDQHSANTP
jgi:hypothetical protein